VRDFYQNGGGQALVVRLYKQDGVKATNALLKAGKDKVLVLKSWGEGAWGNNLRARVDSKVSADLAKKWGLTAADLFNLTLHDMQTGATETFLNISIKDSPRRVDRVLTNESSLATVSGALPATVPQANDDPTAGQDVWADGPSNGVADADKASDSADLDLAAYTGDENAKTGIYALNQADLFNILCIPPDKPGADVVDGVYAKALSYCVERRAMLLVDAPSTWKSAGDITANNNAKLTALNLTGDMARNAALFFPRVIEPDPMRDGQLDTYVPCGIMAGLFSRTDANRGVWKAPAGIDAALNGVQGLSVTLTDKENGMLNPLGVNCLRTFPVFGTVAWGARTLRGADQAADEYKYIPVRRTALFIEESLYRGLKWVVFEPNDEPLWAQIRLNVGAFMHNLFRQGAFQGTSPRDAYFVKCDKDTTTQNDINLGIVNIAVGFAPLKPAEFVVIQLQQMAGQIAV
jgi:phage tail sheath protein FI